VDAYLLSLLVIGVLLLVVTLGSGLIGRLPLSYALIYLIVGVGLGPYGLNLVKIRPDTQILERVSEFVVLISLFGCGLKISRPIRFSAWQSTARLIGFLMPISIFAVAAAGHWLLKLDWAPAILLGAILAPTDPVLASEVQLYDPSDRDELRFGLTSEGGLNDALAFPFVYFGLHLLEDGNWQNWFKQWAAVDLVWAIIAGTVVGFAAAKAVRWIDRRLQQFHIVDELMEDFVSLSVIFIAYTLAEFVNGYGFLAVFVAGLTMRRRRDGEKSNSQLRFIERIEKLSEIGTILLLGSLLLKEPMFTYAGGGFLIAGLLLFVVRPIGAWVSTIGLRVHPATRWLYGWFGIRGVGSIYYLAYALKSGLEGDSGERIAWITYWTIAISIFLHGVTSTPLMKWYERNIEGNTTLEENTAQREEQGKGA
jgi:NhaP-type Na+/H+ or K+/H+ antiporter